MYPIRKEVIDSVLQERSICLINGPSGAGKTILTFQGIEEWYNRSTFFGYSAKPNPSIVYFSYDRMLEDAHDTLRKHHFSFPNMKLYSGLECDPVQHPKPSVFQSSDCVIIDGIDCMVDNPNDGKQVKTCLHTFYRLLKGTSCGLIAISGSGKAKIGEGYANSRERSLGSSLWSRLTGTNINILYDEMALINSRTVFITPRDENKTVLELDFDDKGRMVAASASSDDDKLTSFLKLLPPTFSKAAANDIGEGLRLGTATVSRYLNRLMADGRLTKIEYGHYKKMQPN